MNDEKIPYMLVGSFVSSIYGEPRTTQDVDLVVQLQKSNILNLIANKSGMSEKQFKDALRVYQYQKENLDMYYIKEKAKLLNVFELFNKIKEVDNS